MNKISQPRLIVIAGPNGSGKSTLTDQLKQMPEFPNLYINADDIKKNEGISDKEAWEKAKKQRFDALKDRRSFAFETVFSHTSKIDLMEAAKEAGYWVELHFVCLQNAEMNVQRVETRKQAGGHDVPPDKIRSRYTRSMQLLTQALQFADEVIIYNNSWANPEMIAHKTCDGKISVYPLTEKEPRSIWTKTEIEKLLGLDLPQLHEDAYEISEDVKETSEPQFPIDEEQDEGIDILGR